MDRSKNLRPYTSEEAKYYGRIGGVKSGESRRRRRKAQEYADLILGMPLGATQEEEIALLEEMGLEIDDCTQLGLMVASLIKGGQAGDVNAAKLALMLIGEMPADKQEFSGLISNPTPIIVKFTKKGEGDNETAD